MFGVIFIWDENVVDVLDYVVVLLLGVVYLFLVGVECGLGLCGGGGGGNVVFVVGCGVGVCGVVMRYGVGGYVWLGYVCLGYGVGGVG